MINGLLSGDGNQGTASPGSSAPLAVIHGWMSRKIQEVRFFNTRGPVVYRRRLIKWVGVLGSERFQRLDRSLIIQFSLLRSTEWINRDQTLLRFEGLTEPLTIGRAASARLKKILNQESERKTV